MEVKFHLPAPERMKAKLASAGAVFQHRVFEHNECFDDERRRLRARGALLRLRCDSGFTLTYKERPAAAAPSTEVKCYRELETVIGDGDTLSQILQRIGFRPTVVYEKWRETWAVDGAMLTVDTLPFGDFLEIEGSTDAIRRWAHTLGLAWERRITANYLGIFGALKSRMGLGFSDVTFDNVNGLPVDFARYEHLFAAGPENGEALPNNGCPPS
jgi:adenylate cyclase class 2